MTGRTLTCVGSARSSGVEENRIERVLLAIFLIAALSLILGQVLQHFYASNQVVGVREIFRQRFKD